MHFTQALRRFAFLILAPLLIAAAFVAPALGADDCAPKITKPGNPNHCSFKAGAAQSFSYTIPAIKNAECVQAKTSETVGTVREANVTLKMGSAIDKGKAGGVGTRLVSDAKPGQGFTATVTTDRDTKLAIGFWIYPKTASAKGAYCGGSSTGPVRDIAVVTPVPRVTR